MLGSCRLWRAACAAHWWRKPLVQAPPPYFLQALRQAFALALFCSQANKYATCAWLYARFVAASCVAWYCNKVCMFVPVFRGKNGPLARGPWGVRYALLALPLGAACCTSQPLRTA